MFSVFLDISISGMRVCVLSFVWCHFPGCECGDRDVGGFLFSQSCVQTELFDCKLSCLILYFIAMPHLCSLPDFYSSNEDSLSF